MFVRLLLTALLVKFSSADCDLTTQGSILQCYAPYLQYFGVTAPTDQLPAYQDLATAMENKLNKLGQQAMVELCSHANDLNSCLNGTMYPIDVDCYNHLTGNSAEDSYSYMEENAVHDYECNAGYAVLTTEFYCLQAVQTNQADQLAQCESDLNNNINNGMDVCKAYDQYISCESVIFAKYCDYNAGVFYCNVLRVALDSVYNVCDTSGQLTPCPDYH